MNHARIEYAHLGGQRYRMYLDSFWQFVRTYADENGYEKVEGKYQGLPPI
jgi:hypothetical protein